MAGGEPRLGTTATYMRHNDHGTTRPSTEIDRLHDRTDNEYRIFSAGSVRKWSKFGLIQSSASPTKIRSKVSGETTHVPAAAGRSSRSAACNDRSPSDQYSAP